MTIAFDEQIRQHEDCGSAEARALMRIDWHGLRARLLAAREMGRALAAGRAAGESGSFGSFSGQAARMIDTFAHSLAAVNPNDSANRNAGEAIEAFVADEFSSGDRG